MQTEQPPTSSSSLLASLAPWLIERCRELNHKPVQHSGDYVLYWMHHAVRAHENPALDTAILLANELQLPVLVYQGLGGEHPFNNDRHTAFILEGARDAAQGLTARGVEHLFHLPRPENTQDPDTQSPLSALCERAALVLTEEFPAPPFKRWTQSFADKSPVFTLAVDASCLVPMQLQPVRFKRAFEFRQHNAERFMTALSYHWVEPMVLHAKPIQRLPVECIDLAAHDPLDLCAAIAMDHTVPPVADSTGGSHAGYARWERFKTAGLKHYGRLRNDAALDWPSGVSRISPYLHYGHVSPFRIARDAKAAGAEKFIDELFIWRELAFNFCFFTDDPEQLECLPAWAIDTLQAHARDVRVVIDDASLARSQSGDVLWDAAQTSLRIHGELHNNLRMTWAKAIPYWRPSPAKALRTLIDLNHRYALDGSDPNSYGGLLWALGLFDRPFPETPVMGKVRIRSTALHRKRIYFAHYQRKVMRPSSFAVRQVAVVGAGVAGLMAARTLAEQGHQVTVFDKSRGLGGRCATRRSDSGGFDHGAQYFTIRSSALRQSMAAWQEAGVIAQWQAKCAVANDQGLRPSSPNDEARFVAKPGMSAFGRYLGAGLSVHTQTRITALKRHGYRWQLSAEGGKDMGVFDTLVIALPAPQAQPLLAPVAEDIADQLGSVRYHPTWTVLLDVGQATDFPFDVVQVDNPDSPLAWVANNASKPEREGHHWVLHAKHAWSEQHVNSSASVVAQCLVEAFCDLSNIEPGSIVSQQAHRWLYADVENPLGQDFIAADDALVVCGDCCRGSRIESAMLSGQAAAGHLLRQWVKEYRQHALVNAELEAEVAAPRLTG